MCSGLEFAEGLPGDMLAWLLGTFSREVVIARRSNRTL